MDDGTRAGRQVIVSNKHRHVHPVLAMQVLMSNAERHSASIDTSPDSRELARAPHPVSTNTRSRYVITRKPSGAFGFELRAHNGGSLLTQDEDMPTLAHAQAMVERVRQRVALGQSAGDEEGAVVCRQSLTGKWYFIVCEGERTLAISRPFDYRSRMDKALYAVLACAPGSRVVVAD